VKPTRTSTLAVVAVLAALVAWLLLRSLYERLPPLPWTGVPALLIAAAAEAWTGRDLKTRIAGRSGVKPAAPLFVSRMVALAKASSLAAAVIAGLAAGFGIYLSGSLSAAIPRQDAVTAALTLAAAVLLACAALYLEYCCRVPNHPDDGPDDLPPAAPLTARRASRAPDRASKFKIIFIQNERWFPIPVRPVRPVGPLGDSRALAGYPGHRTPRPVPARTGTR
jgi:hypothetical protein